MRTTLDVNPRLLDEVVKATGEKSKSKAVNRALGDYLRSNRMKRLLALQGRLDLDLDDWYEFRQLER